MIQLSTDIKMSMQKTDVPDKIVPSNENEKKDKSQSIAKKIFIRSSSFKKPKVSSKLTKISEESLVKIKTNSSSSSSTRSQSGSQSSVLEETAFEKKVTFVIESLLKEKTKSEISSQTKHTKSQSGSLCSFLEETKSEKKAINIEECFFNEKITIETSSHTNSQTESLSSELEKTESKKKALDLVERLLQETTEYETSIINETLVNELLPDERVALLKTLKKAQKQEEKSIINKMGSPLQFVIQERLKKLKSAKDCVKTVREQLSHRYIQLLLEQIKTDQKSLNNFFLAGELIIPSEKLFSFIHKAIKDSKKTEEEIKSWQSFSLMWLNKNKGSLLVKKAQKDIEAIINFRPEDKNGNIDEDEFKTLKNTLQNTLNKQPGIMLKPAETIHSFDKLIDVGFTAYKMNLQGLGYYPKKIIDLLANELLDLQCYLYSRITPSDFLGIVCNQQLTALDHLMEFKSLLCEYVKDSILEEENEFDRSSLIKFFLEIALRSFELNDFQSAACFSLVFFDGIFEKWLPKTLKIVNKSSRHQKALETFNEIYMGKLNYKDLRDRIEKASVSNAWYIPYIEIYSKDFISLQLNKALTDDKSIYDINKIDKISAAIEAAIKGQIQFKSQEAFIYQTDFITENFTRYKNKIAEHKTEIDRDNEREKKAEKFKEVKKKNQK